MWITHGCPDGHRLEKEKMRILAFFRKFLVLVMVALCLGGCNTISGMGKDIESLGRTIKRAAD
jgi:predicted small secreted protein